MDPEQEVREFQREYLDFLDDGVSYEWCISGYTYPACPQEDTGIYYDRVREMVRSQSRRLLVNVNDLRRKNPQRAIK